MKFDTVVLKLLMTLSAGDEEHLPELHPIYGNLKDCCVGVIEFDPDTGYKGIVSDILDYVTFAKPKRLIIISSHLYVCDHVIDKAEHYFLDPKDKEIKPIKIIPETLNLITSGVIGNEAFNKTLVPNTLVMCRFSRHTGCFDYLNKVHIFDSTLTDQGEVINAYLADKLNVYYKPDNELDIKAISKIQGHPQIQFYPTDSLNDFYTKVGVCNNEI